MARVNGLHHITAIAGPPQENLDFYAGILGMRLVKKSVNQDDPGTYHLFYADAVGHPGIEIHVHSSEQILLRPAAAIPVALIVAEAVANAIEHGFAERDEGRIDVELARNDGKVTVEVHDDGKGPPPDFDLASHGSLGLNIAGMLAEQLDGTFVLIRDRRTTARLVLPG